MMGPMSWSNSHRERRATRPDPARTPAAEGIEAQLFDAGFSGLLGGGFRHPADGAGRRAGRGPGASWTLPENKAED
jgi:hypothetical protein